MKKQKILKRVLSLLMAVVMITGVVFIGCEVKATETSETAEYNDVVLTFASDDSNGNTYFTVEITGGADYGKIKDELYGTNWKTTWSVGDTGATAYATGNSGSSVNRICIQQHGTKPDSGKTEVVIKAGTVFSTKATDEGCDSTPLRLVNGIRLVKNESGKWETAQNEIAVTLDSVDSNNPNNVYLNVEITGGPDVGKTISEVYGTDWNTAWKIGDTGATAYTCSGVSRICVQGLGTAAGSDLTEITLAEDSLFNTILTKNPDATPMKLTNSLKLVKLEDGTWVKDENDVVISLDRVDNNNVYLNAEIIGGRNTGSTIGDVYGDKYATTWKLGDGTLYSYDTQFLAQGLGTKADSSQTEIVIEAGTVLPVDKGTNRTPIRLVNGLKLAKNITTDEWDVVQNKADIILDYVNGNNIFLNAEIVSGPDAGKTISKVYGDKYATNWNARVNGKTVSVYSYGNQLLVQGLGTADESATEVILPVDSFFYASSQNPDATPLLVTGIKLVKNEEGTWESAENEMAISMGYVSGDDVYLDVEIVGGTDKGNTMKDAYSTTSNYEIDWKMSGTRNVVAYNIGDSQIIVQGLKLSDSNVTEVVLEAGTVLGARNNKPNATPIRLANSIKLVKDEAGVWSGFILRVADVNTDDFVDVGDLVRMKHIALGNVVDKMGLDLSDLDADGDVDSQDCSRMRSRLVNFSFVADGNSDYTIVYPKDATENEKFAATELQYFIESATGAYIPCVSETSNRGGKCIYVGATYAADMAGIAPAYEEVENNGFILKRVNDTLFLKGYTDIGTRNSVYELLNTLFDYEFYAEDEIFLTKTSNVSLPVVDKLFKPDFEWRGATYLDIIRTPLISHRMRFNSFEEIFVTGYNVHNMMTIIDPDVYDWTAEKYQDWYSPETWNGQSGLDEETPTQLCYSNSDMREEFTKKLIELIKDSSAPYMLIGIEDNYYSCTCETCAAEKTKYNTDAAVMIKFINQVQADVDTWFAENRPGEEPIMLLLLAYHQLRWSPTTYNEATGKWEPIDDSVVLNEHSGVLIAASITDYYVPFTDASASDRNYTYGQILGWSSISDNMAAWTYSLYLEKFMFFNSFESMQENYKLLYDNGANIIYDETGYFESGFSHLKAYVMSKLQWDKDLDIETLIVDFFEHYFAEAGNTMKKLFDGEREWLNHIHDKNWYYENAMGRLNDNLLDEKYWPYSKDDRNFVEKYIVGSKDYMALEDYMALIDQAYEDIESLKTTDQERYEVLYNRILGESLQFRYLLIELYSSKYSEADLLTMKKEFKADFEKFGFLDAYTFTDLWSRWGID